MRKLKWERRRNKGPVVFISPPQQASLRLPKKREERRKPPRHRPISRLYEINQAQKRKGDQVQEEEEKEKEEEKTVF
jgi:hypothetical protein